MTRDKPLIAIVGRPNVGKSTLYNRLVGGRPALVHDTPGLTRDRRYGEVDYFGHELRVVDTGGLDPEAETEVIGAGIHRQARLAVEESDAVLFAVDATAGVTALDREVAGLLRPVDKPVLVAANKVDNVQREALASEFFELGLGEVFPVSAVHGRGVDELLEALVARLELPPPAPPARDEADQEAGAGDREPRPAQPLRVALVGKPNAGKSSLLNRLVGGERALVHHEPGTTMDPVDTRLDYGGRSYVLVDTAGIRRKARIEAETEKIAVSLALNQIKRADVAVLLIDAAQGPSEQDARLAGAIEDLGRAVVVALNKSDLLGGPAEVREAEGKVRDVLHFLPYAPRVRVSALRGDGVHELMTAVNRVAGQYRRRIPTAELNRFFAEVCEAHPPPLYRGRSVRIHYITQGGVAPPTFLLWANRADAIAPSYKRFIQNRLRDRYGFAGTPLRVIIKAKRKKKRRR